MSTGGLFSFNPAAGETPETLKRRRAIAEQLLANATGQSATTIGGGLAALGQAIGGRLALGRVNRAETAGQQGAADVFSKLFGGGTAAPGETAAVPGTEPVSGTPDYGSAIASIESGGRYDAVGPTNAKLGRPLGKYQIMEANIGPWSQEALGRAVTPEEFLADPKIQDAVFNAKFGEYVKQYGAEGAAQAWLGGPGAVGKTERKDVLGTSVGEYGQRFMKSIGGGTPAVAEALSGGGVDLAKFATGGAAARPDSFSGLQPTMSSGLSSMISSAPPDIQKELQVLSGYRSPETQERLWQNALKKYGSASAARKWVAPPGRSQHGKGNAIDWKFASPRAREWAHANAGKYGFTFPLSNEPWHMELAGARSGGGGTPAVTAALAGTEPIAGTDPAAMAAGLGPGPGAGPPIRSPLAAPVAPVAAPAAPPVAPTAPAATGVAPVARALGVDPLPQTSALPGVGGVTGAGHESLSPGAQAVSQALAGGGGTDTLAGGGGKGLLGRIFGGRTGTPPAGAGGGGGVPSAAATGVPGAGGSPGTPGAPGAGGGFSPRAQQAIAVLQNPWANEGQQAVAGAILKQEMEQATPQARATLEKTLLDIEQAQHPELVPPTQAEAAQIERGKAQTDLDRQAQDLAKARLQFDVANAKSTTDIKNYDAWAADEVAAGRKPALTRLQYEQELRKAAAPTTEIRLTDTAEESEAKERGKGAVAMFTKFTDDAPDAEAFALSVDRLGQLAAVIDPGTEAGLIDWFRRNTGIEFGEGAGKLQAFQTMVSYMAPRMRPPGSGAASDFDARQFLGSLPSLLGTTEGNQIAVETLSGMATQRVALVHISQDYMAGVISKEDALKQMRSLPDPFAAFKARNAAPDGDDPVPPKPDSASDWPSQSEWNAMSDDEKSAFEGAN